MVPSPPAENQGSDQDCNWTFQFYPGYKSVIPLLGRNAQRQKQCNSRWPMSGPAALLLEKKRHKTIQQFHNRAEICSISPVRSSTVLSSRVSEGTPLIKQDIVHQVIERTGLPRTKAEAAVDTVFEGLKQALAAGERIELRGFGVFSVRARKTGIGRNPRTGTEVSIAPGKAVRFKPGKELHSIEPGKVANA